ncbi:hypothetical protein [Arsenicibacter rosenii]|uniref:Uncharacterized protein n=1 Tax=Arsenicibacter rosenii TaxID=1750698 RepID=A0A1S2VFE9_9BACT|nr:hypothetical protein [Arsenicibacter rosenii]OIN57015.1 hypothetical protein BLX24_21940 [Arsenicibacter rosenii]
MSKLYANSEPPTDAFSSHVAQASANTPALHKSKLAGITTAALLLGGATWTLLAQPTEDGEPDADPQLPVPGDGPVAVAGGKLHLADVTVAREVNSNRPFGEAFAVARDEIGPGGVFVWKGGLFNTFTKEEWQDLSLQQRHEFLAGVGYEPDSQSQKQPSAPADPIIIEGVMNDQRVMGLDFDHDGVVDTLVLEGADGFTYRVVDATGDEGLDVVYQIDTASHEILQSIRLDEPFMLPNSTLQQGLEEAMANELMESVFDEPVVTPLLTVAEHEVSDDDEMPYQEEEHYDTGDDGYVTDTGADDIDEPQAV